MDYQSIEIDGYTLFEKAAMPGDSDYMGTLEDRACFLYMVSGASAAIEAAGKTMIMTNEAVLKRCGNYISQFEAGDNSEFCEAIAVYFHPGFIRKIYKDEIPDFHKQASTSNNSKKIKVDSLIQGFINNLIPYFENPELMDEELAIVKIKELVLLLLKSERRESMVEFFSELFATPTQLALQDVVENNLYNHVTIDQLAFLSGMSVSTFKREFKKHFSQSPGNYIRNQRMDKAKRLLKMGQKRINEIADACGYNDLSSFSHVFQKVVGQSPSSFRLNQMSKSLN